MKRNSGSGVTMEVKQLENIRIASPCRADWNEMTGDDRVRTCAACAKQVFNLSELTRAEAEALLAEKHGDLCGRFYQRKDGTILLADCTVGGSGAKARSFVLATALAAGAAYAKLHRGAPPSEATQLDAAIDVPPTDMHATLVEHDSPPPPRKLVPVPLIQPIEIGHVTERVYVTAGAIAISESTVDDMPVAPKTSTK